MSLNAESDTPWLGVHMITEFIFCPRAGLITYERNQEEDEEEQNDAQQPQLRFLPKYDLSEIEVALNRAIDDIKRWSLIGIIAIFIAAAVGFGFSGSDMALGLAILTLIIILSIISPILSRISTLSSRRREALNAKPKEPDPQTTDNESVNWWDLLAAGFRSVPYRDKLRDPHWRVAGKPWRVLQKGSLRIPVWRRRGSNWTEKLRGQHYARIAAYCHLIEEAEGAQSPYGIILLGDTYQALTISNGRGSRSAFHKGLRKARDIVNAACHGKIPDEPESQLCRGCPYGKPFVYQPGISNSRPGRLNVEAYPILAVDGRYYHSECGDRFRWVPPHQKAR